MPRPSKIVPALARVRANPPEDPLDAPAVVALTREFLSLKVDVLRTLVDKGIELGEILIRAQPLMHGHYQRWQRERLEIDPNTGDNYVALARLAKESPGLIREWKELGPSKLYRIAQLPPRARETVLARVGDAKMIDAEFARLTAPYVERKRKVTGNMRAHGARMQVQAFARKLEKLRLPAIEDAAIRDGLRADLQALCRAVRALVATLE